MKVHWWTYKHCLFVLYLASVAFGYGWMSDTKFLKFSDKDWIWICKIFFGYGSEVEKSISAHLWYVTSWRKFNHPLCDAISEKIDFTRGQPMHPSKVPQNLNLQLFLMHLGYQCKLLIVN